MPISNFIFWLSRSDFLYYINFENDVFIDDEIDLRPISDILKIYLNKCDSYQIKILKDDKKSKN